MKAVLISCFGYYDIRMKYVERLLIENDFEVVMLFSDFNHINKSYCSFDNENVIPIHVTEYSKNISLKRIISHFSFSAGVKRQLEIIKPDLIYSMIPPNNLCKVLAEYKKQNGCKLIFDIIDLWPESFPYLRSKNMLPPSVIWRNLRETNLDSANHVVLECEYYNKFLKNILPEKSSIVYICKTNEYVKLKRENIFSNDVLKLGYLGSINSIIDIDAIIRLLSDIKKKQMVHFSIVGAGERKEYLLSLLSQNHIDFDDYGKIFDSSELFSVFSKCHYGLNMYKKQTCIGLTMKSLDYFNMGLPVINCNIYDTGELIDIYNAGLRIDEKNYFEAIKKLQNFDIKSWEAQCNGVQKLVENELSEEVCIRRLNEVLRKVIEQK